MVPAVDWLRHESKYWGPLHFSNRLLVSLWLRQFNFKSSGLSACTCVDGQLGFAILCDDRQHHHNTDCKWKRIHRLHDNPCRRGI